MLVRSCDTGVLRRAYKFDGFVDIGEEKEDISAKQEFPSTPESRHPDSKYTRDIRRRVPCAPDDIMGSSHKKDSKRSSKSSASSKHSSKSDSKRPSPPQQPSYDEFMADMGPTDFLPYQEGESSTSYSMSGNAYPKTKAVRSEAAVTLQGPLEVAGGVRSGGNVALNGDFDIKDRIEAYGAIDINGNVMCR